MSIELGKFNQLDVVKEVDFGVYLDGGEEGEILLPTRYAVSYTHLDVYKRQAVDKLLSLIQTDRKE